jgi:hypothetical protein
LFSGQDIRERSDSFVSIVLAFFGQSGSGRILKVGDQFNVNEPFMVELEIKLDSFTNFVPAGKFVLPVALNLNNLLALEQLATAEKRQTDLLVGAVKFTEDYLVSLPEGVTPDIKPLASEFSNSVGSYRVDVKMDPSGSVRASRELTIKKDLVSATEYIQFRELVRNVVNNYNIEIAYKADPAAPLARQPKSVGKPDVRSIFTTDGLPEYFEEKKISAAQARKLESSLLKSPELLDARRDLVRYYSPARRGEPTARRNARIRHYRWFIENRPEARAVEVFGIYGLYHHIDEVEFNTLKPAWLAAVKKNEKNSAVRLNAFEFVKMHDRTSAENILVEGMRLDPSHHGFPLELSNLYSSPADPAKTESSAQRTERIRKQLDYGKVALQILKSERSSERDAIRKTLLQGLAQAAFETSDLAAARSLATELILDFGQDADDVNYDSAAHIGNIVLGQVALRENNVQKAAEHLLIAIRAPLRKPTSWLPEIDTTLARELHSAGQKDAVLEYLKLCEGLWNLKNEKELFEYQSRALKKWQEQIRQGQTPSFDFMKP